ncbi:MAG: hypothetical protein Q4P24_09560, partial [Rhodobacterales bacterium]|nr:hypothetical protein [Rhodobacterales bacterium]
MQRKNRLPLRMQRAVNRSCSGRRVPDISWPVECGGGVLRKLIISRNLQRIFGRIFLYGLHRDIG